MSSTGWQEKDDRTIAEIRAYLEREELDAFIPWKVPHLGYLTNYYIHGVGLEVHEEPLLHTPMLEPTPLDGLIYFEPGAVVSSEWFTHLWTVEEPFVLTADGWEPLVELRGLTDPAA